MNCPKCGHLTDKKPLFSSFYDHCPVCDGGQDIIIPKERSSEEYAILMQKYLDQGHTIPEAHALIRMENFSKE